MVNIGPNLPVVTPKKPPATKSVNDSNIKISKEVSNPQNFGAVERRKTPERRKQTGAQRQKRLLELRSGRDRRHHDSGSIDINA